MGIEGALCHCGSPAAHPVDVCSGGALLSQEQGDFLWELDFA